MCVCVCVLCVCVCVYVCVCASFPGGSVDKESACNEGRQETRVRFLGQEDPLEEGMTTHFSILAWRLHG